MTSGIIGNIEIPETLWETQALELLFWTWTELPPAMTERMNGEQRTRVVDLAPLRMAPSARQCYAYRNIQPSREQTLCGALLQVSDTFRG